MSVSDDELDAAAQTLRARLEHHLQFWIPEDSADYMEVTRREGRRILAGVLRRERLGRPDDVTLLTSEAELREALKLPEVFRT